MKTYTQQKLLFIFVTLTLLASRPVLASHIVGSDFTYIYQGDTTIGSTLCNIYQVSLSIYEDCYNGNPAAIAQDNPSYFCVFINSAPAYTQISFDSVYNASDINIPAINTPSPCGGIPNPYPACLHKRTFTKTYYLPPNASGYIVTYQRCCRNAEIVNIVDPSDNGATYFCEIPAAPLVNSSAVFNNYPPQIICVNLPLVYDNSATDADGDSLSYGFCAAINGPTSSNNSKPIPLPQPYDSVTYISPPYSAQVPFTGTLPIELDPVTGLMTGTPNLKGRYLVTVYCNEWRGGVVINTIRREFQFIVNDCTSLEYAPFAGYDTTIMEGDSVQFGAAGGTDYSWTPITYLSNPAIGNPTGYFPVAGSFTYTLHALSDSGCTGTSTRTILVLAHSLYRVPNAFTPNNDGLNDYLKPIPLLNATLLHFKVFNHYGNLVYNGGSDDAGWDGTYQGRKQDMGVYLWEVIYLDNYGTTRVTTGNTTLIR